MCESIIAQCNHAAQQGHMKLMDKKTSLVKRQYTEWPYPEPIENIEVWKTMGSGLQPDLKNDHFLLWPERSYNPRLSILIAGCGTMEAAVEAYNHPQMSVLGIDLSQTSLEHNAMLKKKHDLKNLELKQMDLRDVASLGRKFDLIISYGVIHHLPEPQLGLMALSSVLQDNGVIFLTLYGKYFRLGVSMLQEALRLLKVGQTQNDIDFTRGILESLPPYHPLQPYVQNANDLHFDAGIVDTFLHPQETVFSVRDILALAANSNLNFQGWYDNLFYYPDGALHHNQPLLQRIASLPEQEQWAVLELLVPPPSGHAFMLRRSSGERNYNIRFDDESFKHLVPTLRHRLRVSDENGATTIKREWHKETLTKIERDIFLSVDGKLTIGDIVTRHGETTTEPLETARLFFSRMWRLGHMNFQKPRKRLCWRGRQ